MSPTGKREDRARLRQIASGAIVFIILCLNSSVAAMEHSQAGCPFISFHHALERPPTTALQRTLLDARSLLDTTFGCDTAHRVSGAMAVEIHLEYAPSDEPGFRVSGSTWQDIRRITISAGEPGEMSSGIYALLQEKLGIQFLHPRQTVFPAYRQWPLPEHFDLRARPRFAVRGFHLHTQHPTELEMALHQPGNESLQMVREYIDWLARNGQNHFQFYLLRTVDRHHWPEHARAIVDYAHQRDMGVGVMVSASMLQQHAFQLVKLLRPERYSTQARRNLEWLMAIPWDAVILEPTTGEYLPDMRRLFPGVLEAIERMTMDEFQTPLFYATHVIHPRDRIGGGTNDIHCEHPVDPRSGILIHTVMCYDLQEPLPGVYGNRDFHWMRERARCEVQRRQTWYWPESSYWVAFDNSVPLLLLPYLDSRLRDILLTADMGLDGHVTFSSGWEWGYWLFDWSIAHWSWQWWHEGQERQPLPAGRLHHLAADGELARLMERSLDLQNHFLKDHELLRYLPAFEPFAEAPPPFDFIFQPRPERRPAHLMKRASATEAQAVLDGPVRQLEAFAHQSLALIATHQPRNGLERELLDGLHITALRALHRSATLQATIARREKPRLWHQPTPSAQQHLEQAERIRSEALAIVRQREVAYRYPVSDIASRRQSFTAYDFGYLYPVHELYFWQREEEQVATGRFDMFYRPIWNYWRVLGLSGLW